MDFPYVVFILILIVLAYLNWKQPADKYFKIAVGVVFVFIAFRAPVVGADTWNYYRYLTGIRNWYNNDSRDLEMGFALYHDFCHKVLMKNGLMIMIVNTILSMGFVYLAIKKYAGDKVLAVLSIFLFFSYASWFIALRQTLGFSIYLGGLLYLLADKKQKWLVYAACCVAGWYFHTTIAIYATIGTLCYFIPVYKRWIHLAFVIGSAVLGVVFEKFDVLGFFKFFLTLNISMTERVDGYMIDAELNDTTATLNILLRTTVVATIAILLIDKDKINHIFTKFFVFGVVAFNLLYTVPMINRIVFIFWVFGSIVVSWIFGENYMNSKYKKYISILVLLMVLYFGRVYLISQTNYDLESASKMHPYYFFFQDYHTHPSITQSY